MSDPAGQSLPPNSQPVAPPAAARPASDSAPLELVDDTCPRCHAPLAHEAVMCVACGYDLKANVIREPEVGEVAAPTPAAGPKDFVVPGRGNAQVLATCGVFIALAALIASGVAAKQWGIWVVLGSVAISLYNILLHTCTGVVAVIAAAKLSEERFTRLDLVAARMFVAVSLFYTLSAIRLPLPWPTLSAAIAWVSALAVYFLAVWLLFMRDRYAAALIALAHFLIWMVLQLGAGLSAWVASGKVPVSPAPGA